ncbi:Uncharacterised protein [Weissella viridescens]|uniref:Uncharacterized protein n=1 Tax=Weissella viridescens TaxID=1629 RepID=A0A380NVY5_WEIVI|nr:Uncharacterised protein [Weissella viridescens]
MVVLQPQHASTLVWALPISLAATVGIDFLLFLLLMNVSVHNVYLQFSYVFTNDNLYKQVGFPHSESPDQSLLTAPEAYRC